MAPDSPEAQVAALAGDGQRHLRRGDLAAALQIGLSMIEDAENASPQARAAGRSLLLDALAPLDLPYLPLGFDAGAERDEFVWNDEDPPRRAAVEPENDLVRVFDAATGAALYTIHIPPPGPEPSGNLVGAYPEFAAWSDDHAWLLVNLWGGTWLLDAATGARRAALTDDIASVVAFGVRGDRLLTVEPSGLRVWDLGTGGWSREIPFGYGQLWPADAAISADGTRVATVAEDGAVSVWPVDSAFMDGESIVRFVTRGFTYDMDWSSDERRLLASDDGRLRLYDVESGALLRTFAFEEKRAQLIGWNGADTLVLGSMEGDRDVVVWDAATGEVRLHVATGRHIFRTRWAAGEDKVLIYTEDGTLSVWDVASGQQLSALPVGTGVSLWNWHAASSSVVTYWAEGGTARVWDAVSGRERLTLRHGDVVSSAAWSADGSAIVTSSYDGSVAVWDAATGAQRFRILLDASVIGAAWNSAGTQIIARPMDYALRVWDAVTGEERLRLEHAAAYSYGGFWNADDTQIMAWGEEPSGTNFDNPDVVRVWDAATGELRLRLIVRGGDLAWAGWTADGRRIYTETVEGVQLWDALTGEQLLSYEGSWLPATERIVSKRGGSMLRIRPPAAPLSDAELIDAAKAALQGLGDSPAAP